MDIFPTLSFDFYLVTRGDEEEIPDATAQQIEKLKQAVRERIGVEPGFFGIDTQALLKLAEKRKHSSQVITWFQQPGIVIDDSYVGLVRLKDYVEFLKDENGALNESIFESNVRGYQGSSPVNRQIRASLEAPGGVNFWLRNNGVTIISSGKVQPESGMRVRIEDPQIVNGLQTSREIFKHFATAAGNSPPDEAVNAGLVLVRVIPLANEAERDEVIKSTNSQNPMNKASLRATDEIHRQIEDVFVHFGLFYDRKKGFYKDQGKPLTKIVSVTELTQAVVSIIHQRPDDARARPGKYLSNDREYNSVFGKNVLPVVAYVKCIQIMEFVQSHLESQKLDKADIQNVKPYVAMILTSEICNTARPTGEDVRNLSLETAPQKIDFCIASTLDSYRHHSANDYADAVAKGPHMLASIFGDHLVGRYPERIKSTPKPKKKVRDTLEQFKQGVLR